MPHAPDHVPPHTRPIDLSVHLLIDQPHDRDIVPPHQVQPVLHLAAGLLVVGGPDDALDGVGEHEVGQLVAGEEGAEESAAVGGEEEDLFFERLSTEERDGWIWGTGSLEI